MSSPSLFQFSCSVMFDSLPSNCSEVFVIERKSVIPDPAGQFLHRVWWRISVHLFRTFLVSPCLSWSVFPDRDADVLELRIAKTLQIVATGTLRSKFIT